ncbi:MAG: hypothetical protein CL920_02765 [Deltaproteobacteria bacterium]|nr:hypothetical protein [Deltaproteobacteria bacterium]
MPQRPSRKWIWQFIPSSLVGSIFILLGLWCFLHPAIFFMYGVLWFFLGAGILGGSIYFLAQSASMSTKELSSLGLGVVVAETRLPQPPYQCQRCKKTFHFRPTLRGDEVFCSKSCEFPSRQPEIEEEPILLPPPLYAEEIHSTLEKAIQLAERALRNASEGKLDRPLLKATRKGLGAGKLTQHVITSLLVWGAHEWATRLLNAPPPEPTLEGGSTGSARFFSVARECQQFVLELEQGEDPFEILQIEDALEEDDIRALRQEPHSPEERAAFEQIEKAFQQLQGLIVERTIEMELPNLS